MSINHTATISINCSDNIHKEFGTEKCAKILLKKEKLVLSQNLILDIYTEIQELEEGEQTGT
jgi:hypothetical protein